MKTPEKIYCDLHHSWDEDSKMVDGGIEYVRKDIAKLESEKMAKEFTIFFNRHVIQFKNKIGEKGGVVDLQELFTEFINSRKK